MLALKEFPEIEQSAGTMLAPYQFGSSNSRYTWHGRSIGFGVTEVTDGFKDLLGLEVVEGRWFSADDDGQTYEAVVINQEMRRDLFGDGPGHRPEHRRRPTRRMTRNPNASGGSSASSPPIAKTASSTASATT